jgi:hypothetical protein
MNFKKYEWLNLEYILDNNSHYNNLEYDLEYDFYLSCNVKCDNLIVDILNIENLNNIFINDINTKFKYITLLHIKKYKNIFKKYNLKSFDDNFCDISLLTQQHIDNRFLYFKAYQIYKTREKNIIPTLYSLTLKYYIDNYYHLNYCHLINIDLPLTIKNDINKIIKYNKKYYYKLLGTINKNQLLKLINKIKMNKNMYITNRLFLLIKKLEHYLI